MPLLHWRFNPRPPLLAGDAKLVALRCGQGFVSIRARHCWRAMRSSIGQTARQPRFNPRPPLLAGDASTFWLLNLLA